MNEAEVDVHAVADPADGDDRRERRFEAEQARHLGGDDPREHAAIGGGKRCRGLRRELELAGAVLGQEVLGLAAGLAHAARDQRQERLPAAHLGKQERPPFGAIDDRELVLERADQREAGLARQLGERVTAVGARAGRPVAVVLLGDVAEHEIERRRTAELDAGTRRPVGAQPQLADRVERRLLGQRPERRQRLVRRHPAGSAVGMQLVVEQRHAAAAHLRREVADRMEDELVAGHVASSRSGLPLSQTSRSKPASAWRSAAPSELAA